MDNVRCPRATVSWTTEECVEERWRMTRYNTIDLCTILAKRGWKKYLFTNVMGVTLCVTKLVPQF